jgi:hypothetical protein
MVNREEENSRSWVFGSPKNHEKFWWHRLSSLCGQNFSEQAMKRPQKRSPVLRFSI